MSEAIGFLPEDKELHDQELALQSSSSIDLVEDKSFLESVHVHEKSSFVCVLCEDVAVSGEELSHSFSSMQQQQPRKLSRVCRGHPSQSQLSTEKLGYKGMTHKLAASKSTRCSKTQEATGAETSKALLSVLSSGRLASFGGSSLVALMVCKSVPKSLSASKLAYEENLAELAKEAAKNSFKWQSLILPNLSFSILCFASLCLTWRS